MRLLDPTTPEFIGGQSHRPDCPWSPDEGPALEGVANLGQWDAHLTAMASERADRPQNGVESHGLWTWYCNQAPHKRTQPAATSHGARVESRGRLDRVED